MKTKIIPFDDTMAMYIQDGKMKGKIRTKNGLPCRIVASCGTDLFVKRTTIESTLDWCYPYNKNGCLIDGSKNGGTEYDLVLEVPDNESREPQFKPFDKVLVRYPDKTELCVSKDIWLPGIFQYKSVNSNLYFVSGKAYKDCIPYDGNENLVWTTNKPNEE